jgi:uncharacterized protein YbaP (TraB family)
VIRLARLARDGQPQLQAQPNPQSAKSAGHEMHIFGHCHVSTLRLAKMPYRMRSRLAKCRVVLDRREAQIHSRTLVVLVFHVQKVERTGGQRAEETNVSNAV